MSGVIVKGATRSNVLIPKILFPLGSTATSTGPTSHVFPIRTEFNWYWDILTIFPFAILAAEVLVARSFWFLVSASNVVWLRVNKLEPVSNRNEAFMFDSRVASRYSVPPLLCERGIFCSIADTADVHANQKVSRTNKGILDFKLTAHTPFVDTLHRCWLTAR